MKTSLIASALLLSAAIAAPASAQNVRVLTVAPGLCEEFKVQLRHWAATTDGRGAFAVPIAPKHLARECGEKGDPVPVGITSGYTSQSSANKDARNVCVDALSKDYRNCAVVAKVRDQ